MMSTLGGKKTQKVMMITEIINLIIKKEIDENLIFLNDERPVDRDGFVKAASK